MTGSSHDRHAPFWALGLAVLCAAGLATIRMDFGPFWKGYLLDMTGPAWTYILFRGRYTRRADNFWTRFFTPLRTVMLIVAASFAIEGIQYLELYEATFDPWDFAAYISILIPLWIVDQVTVEGRNGV